MITIYVNYAIVFTYAMRQLVRYKDVSIMSSFNLHEAVLLEPTNPLTGKERYNLKLPTFKKKKTLSLISYLKKKKETQIKYGIIPWTDNEVTPIFL